MRMLVGPGSASSLPPLMSATHFPEHLATTPVTFGKDSSLAALACHEHPAGSQHIHQRPGGEFVEEFPLCLHSSFSSFLLKLLFNSAKGWIFCLLFFFKLEFFKFTLFSFNFLVYFASYELLSKIQRSGKVWNKSEMKRSHLFLSDILSLMASLWMTCNK